MIYINNEIYKGDRFGTGKNSVVRNSHTLYVTVYLILNCQPLLTYLLLYTYKLLKV